MYGYCSVGLDAVVKMGGVTESWALYWRAQEEQKCPAVGFSRVSCSLEDRHGNTVSKPQRWGRGTSSSNTAPGCDGGWDLTFTFSQTTTAEVTWRRSVHSPAVCEKLGSRYNGHQGDRYSGYRGDRNSKFVFSCSQKSKELVMSVTLIDLHPLLFWRKVS